MFAAPLAPDYHYHVMRFSQLIESAGIDPRLSRGDAEVDRVTADSRNCAPGSCFVAIDGTADDGHRYIPEALAKGAAAVVCEDPSRIPDGTVYAVVDDTHEVLGRLAQGILGFPARKLTNIAVTGTNGKTTVTHLIRAVLREVGFSPAMLGTICYDTGSGSRPARTTTPDAVSLAEMTAEMVANGRTHLVMETSSHALDQCRTAGIEFQVAVFTNLSRDHLDYHGTMEHYLAAKRSLFEQLGEGATAVINRDDSNVGDLLSPGVRARVFWYGLSPAADLRGRIRRIDLTGSEFDVICGGREVLGKTKLIGRHNVFNWLGAAGACLGLGIDLPAIASALTQTDRIPGRLERIDVQAPYQVFVDYAHTDDALANVLTAFEAVKKGRTILVFGCGGDRDRSKRPLMARVAEDLADLIIVTSDNPRSENPRAIIDEIVAGFSPSGLEKVEIEPDRRAAIELGVAQGREGDVVLVAGKGHESYQIIGDRRIHFDDVEVTEQIVRAREESR